MLLKKLLFASVAFALCAAAQVSPARASGTCPPPQQYSGACIQVIVWAKNPANGGCCQYPNPCAVPAGWFFWLTAEECLFSK